MKLLIVILLLTYSTSSMAAQLRGNLVPPLAKQTVLLDIYQNEKAQGSSRTLSDAHGRFHFQDLSNSADYSYRVRALYHDVPFSSDWLSLSKTNQVTVRVYPSTTEWTAVHCELMHVGVYAEESEQSLRIEQTFILSSTGKQAFYRAEGLVLPLPPNGYDVELGSAHAPGALLQDIELHDRQITVKLPILPDVPVEISLQYSLHRFFDHVDFIQTLPINIDRLGVILFPDRMRVAQGLKSIGNKEMRGMQHAVFLGDYRDRPVKQVRFKVERIPGGFGPLQKSMVLALTLLGVCCFVFIKRKGR